MVSIAEVPNSGRKCRREHHARMMQVALLQSGRVEKGRDQDPPSSDAEHFSVEFLRRYFRVPPAFEKPGRCKRTSDSGAEGVEECPPERCRLPASGRLPWVESKADHRTNHAGATPEYGDSSCHDGSRLARTTTS